MPEQSRIDHNSYRRVLEPWAGAMRKYLYRLPESPGLVCWGPGESGHWSMQANNTALAALAVLAADPDLDESRCGVSRDEIRDTALAMLRYCLQSFVTEKGVAADGKKFNHSWISSLCMERMMHGIGALDEYLTGDDRQTLKSVLRGQCDFLLSYPIEAGETVNNKPESNIWQGCILHRTAMYYPDLPNAEKYRERGTAFLLNGISVRPDRGSREMIAGKAVGDWFSGANFFPSFSCNHHGYMNVGYMVICMSNLAMLHFTCKEKRLTPPEALYRHAFDLWKLIKHCTFRDGRLWRIGGDTRARYCYCQDYAIPMWLMARDVFGDTDCEGFEAGWLKQIETELAAGEPGMFLSARMKKMESESPLYYTRLTGDRAVTLSYGAYWRRIFNEFGNSPTSKARPKMEGAWEDDYHGCISHRSARRMASFCWRGGEGQMGMCLPSEDSAMAEWGENLAGHIGGIGMLNSSEPVVFAHKTFKGGFYTSGLSRVKTEAHLAEGEVGSEIADKYIAMAALPDERTVIVMQKAVVPARLYLKKVMGLNLHIPNDIYNGGVRTFTGEDGTARVKGISSEEKWLEPATCWLDIDGKLGVGKIYGSENLSIYCPPERQVLLKSHAGGQHRGKLGGTIYANVICIGHSYGVTSFDGGSNPYDCGAVLLAGSSLEETGKYFSGGGAALCKIEDKGKDAIRAIRAKGADGKEYVYIANLSGDSVDFALQNIEGNRLMPLGIDAQEVLPENGIFTLNLTGTDSALFEIV